MLSESLFEHRSSYEIITYTGSKRYLAMLIMFMLAILFGFYSVYVLENPSMFSVWGTPIVWVHFLYTLYCIWYHIKYKKIEHSLKVFLIFGFATSFAGIIFGPSGIYSSFFLVFPVIIILISWVYSRKVAYALVALICLLAVYLNLQMIFGGVTYIQNHPSSHVVLIVITVIVSGIFSGIISESNEKHFRRQEEMINHLEEKVKERTLELEASIAKIEENHQKLERAARMESLVDLVTGITKKLSNPVTNILLASSALSDNVHELKLAVTNDKLSKVRVLELMESFLAVTSLFHSSASKVSNLVETLKKLSITESQNNIARFSLKKLIEGVVSDMRTDSRGWKISYGNIDEIECTTFGEHVEMVMRLLIENAYTHGGETGEILVCASSKNKMVTLTISDNGVGIPEDCLDKVFEPFFTSGKGGAGLGLTVVSNLVTTLRGTVTFREQSIGTCAIVVFPSYISI